MRKTNSILQHISAKMKLLFLFAFILLLCGCEETCPTIQDYIFKGTGTGPDDCILCPIFKVLIDTSKNVAVDAWKILAGALIPVVGVVASIYIAIYTLKLVGSFGKQTANDYMTSDKNGLLIFMFKTAVIVFLLSGGMATVLEAAIGKIFGLGGSHENFLLNKIISPLLKSGLEIGQGLAIENGNNNSFDFYSSDMIISKINELLGSPWSAIFEMVRQAIYKFSQVAYEPVAIGQAMICNSTVEGSLFDWHYQMLIYGFILFIFGWLLTLGISFYIVDILIDLMFAAVLLPIGVACAISPKTSGYTQKIWGIFVNVFFNFVMLGIVLGITMKIVDLCLNRAIDETHSGSGVISETGGAIANFMTNYQYHVDANEVEQLANELWNNGNLLLTIVCLSIATMLIPQIKQLASKISGGTSISTVGEKTSAKVGQKAMFTAKTVGRESFNRVLKPSGMFVGTKFARATRLDKLYNKGTYFAAATRGVLTGGGSQGYRSIWNRQNASTYWNNTRSTIGRTWQRVKGWF